MAPSDGPIYPLGCCICFSDEQLDKLGLSDEQLEPGDILHLHALAKVTSIHKSEDCKRVEFTLIHASFESETEEDDEWDDKEEQSETQPKPYF